MSKLVLTLPALYKDNSMHKETLKKKKTVSKYFKLQDQLKSVQKTRKQIFSLIEKKDIKVNLINKIKADIASKTLQVQKMNNAAIVIQRAIKKLLLQRKIKDSSIGLIENMLLSDLQDLSKSLDYVFWNLGNAAEYASNRIKTAYKRSKFRNKINRIKKVYKVMCKNKRTIARLYIRKSIRMFTSKIKIQDAKIEKFHKIRLEKLEKIRENLALITIKNYWKANKMTYRKYMYKCRKVKYLIRKKNATNFLSAEMSLKSELSSYISTPNSELINGEFVDQDLDPKIVQETLLKERKEKLKSAMVSYNIKKPRRKIINPLNLLSIEEKNEFCITTFKGRYSSEFITNTAGTNQSNGSLSTRSTSNRRRVNKLKY
jgi:hypothetical protein